MRIFEPRILSTWSRDLLNVKKKKNCNTTRTERNKRSRDADILRNISIQIIVFEKQFFSFIYFWFKEKEKMQLKSPRNRKNQKVLGQKLDSEFLKKKKITSHVHKNTRRS